MNPVQPIENKEFIGRKMEHEKLQRFGNLKSAAIMIVYGRRRVGKTELIEQSLGYRNLLKFEGLEDQPEKDQIQHVLHQLSKYAEERYIAQLNFNTWVEVFELIAEKTRHGEWTLYLEELQWMANYNNKLISALKYVWDNYFRHNAEFRLVLCGSSPSFMLNQVVHSKALYNRSQQELYLQPFNIYEAKQFLPKISNQEILLAYLTLGGIPEYLKYVRDSASVFLGICQHAFTKDSVFSNEYKKIFISSLSNNAHYHAIVRYLSKIKFATRADIAKHLKIHSGGNLTTLLMDLEECGFIEKYSPIYSENGRGLYRFCIKDPYLMFYYKFIEPVKKSIALGQFDNNPSQAIQQHSYNSWMGFAFERFIRQNQFLIAKILGFSGIPYQWGAYYTRNSETPGFQIDLMYEHSKHVYTICEIKYYADLVDTNIINEMEKKLTHFSNNKKNTIKKVLITSYGATPELIRRAYFDVVITTEDLFKNHYWQN